MFRPKNMSDKTLSKMFPCSVDVVINVTMFTLLMSGH